MGLPNRGDEGDDRIPGAQPPDAGAERPVRRNGESNGGESARAFGSFSLDALSFGLPGLIAAVAGAVVLVLGVLGERAIRRRRS